MRKKWWEECTGHPADWTKAGQWFSGHATAALLLPGFMPNRGSIDRGDRAIHWHSAALGRMMDGTGGKHYSCRVQKDIWWNTKQKIWVEVRSILIRRTAPEAWCPVDGLLLHLTTQAAAVEKWQGGLYRGVLVGFSRASILAPLRHELM